MSNFSIGMAIGTVVGAGMIMAVNPMNKRARRRAYHKAGKLMRQVNHTMRDWT